MSPQRIQRKRTKGWRMPENAIYVGRPTVYGNPFRIIGGGDNWTVIDDNGVEYDDWPTKLSAAHHTVSLFYADLINWRRLDCQPGLRVAIEKLRGHDLACWCPINAPCHADVLLELANR